MRDTKGIYYTKIAAELRDKYRMPWRWIAVFMGEVHGQWYRGQTWQQRCYRAGISTKVIYYGGRNDGLKKAHAARGLKRPDVPDPPAIRGRSSVRTLPSPPDPAH